MGAVTDRDILRRQLHDDIIETLRKRQRPSHPSPQQLFARVAACYVLGRQKTRAPAAVAAETYGNDPDLLKALAAPGMIGKSANAPAVTTVSGWGSELATPANFDRLSNLTRAAGGQCAARKTLSAGPARR